VGSRVTAWLYATRERNRVVLGCPRGVSSCDRILLANAINQKCSSCCMVQFTDCVTEYTYSAFASSHISVTLRVRDIYVSRFGHRKLSSPAAEGCDATSLAHLQRSGVQKIYPAPRVGCALYPTLRFHCHHSDIPVGPCPICFIVLSLVVPTTICEIFEILQAPSSDLSWNNHNDTILLAANSSRTRV
jgi:hypothetical protein